MYSLLVSWVAVGVVRPDQFDLSGNLPCHPKAACCHLFVALHLLCASHQEKLKAGGREWIVFVLQPVLCPDLTVSSFLAYLRGGSSVLLFQFRLESCFWSISPDLYLFVFLFALWDGIEVHEWNSFENQTGRCNLPVHLSCSKWVFHLWYQTKARNELVYINKQTKPTVVVMLSAPFHSTYLLLLLCTSAYNAFIVFEEFFSMVQTVTVLCCNCYRFFLALFYWAHWTFSTGNYMV